ncbi:GDP-L-fucose synthase [Gammaproteobacteria bacterium]|nr:GDP-L-fucose synthase [Gammaproteobacteria bacterium]
MVAKIYIAGHGGMVGSSIFRLLSNGDDKIVTVSRNEVDLTNQAEVANFFEANRFDQVYLTAAKVGGIHANNTYPAEFIYQNLMIQNNVIHSAYKSGVKKLLFFGSSCIYPRLASQPIRETELLDGHLESTNEPYAVAKIAGIKICESYNRQYGVDYRSVMPTNLYGPGDNYHPENSHVIPGLIHRIHSAKLKGKDEVSIWGSGKALREFLYVDDLALGAVHVMNVSSEMIGKYCKSRLSHINVGSGSEIKVIDLAQLIAKMIKFKGAIKTDPTQPDGTPRKLLDSQVINDLGWTPKYTLSEGLRHTYKNYLHMLKLKS